VAPIPHEHLFEQAEALATDPNGRQAELRRAVSAAYYGLFHFTLTAAADMVVGAADRATARYALVYRSDDHGRLRSLCQQLSGTNPQVSLLPSPGDFGRVADFARIAVTLHEHRTLADYDPSRDFTLREVEIDISDAREAVKWFQQATREQQETFLTLLLFRSR
jgi:hypothetical protein